MPFRKVPNDWALLIRRLLRVVARRQPDTNTPAYAFSKRRSHFGGEAPTPFHRVDPKTPLEDERYFNLSVRQSVSRVMGNVSIISRE